MKTVTPEHVGLSSTRLGRIRPVVERYIDEGKFAGVITLVARQGKVAHFECMGMMDLESGKAMQPDAIFPYLLDEQADHQSGPVDAVRGRPGAAQRSDVALHPRF